METAVSEDLGKAPITGVRTGSRLRLAARENQKGGRAGWHTREDSDGGGGAGGRRALRFLRETTGNSHSNLVGYGMEPLKDWEGGSRDSLIHISKG